MGEKASAPVISTTVLNWNRADLLRRTLESYRDTVTVPYELFIVDNGSSDGSRTVIEEFCAATPAAQAIYLPENIGGAAINEGLRKSRAGLLHVSENDFEYRSGWVEEALELFACFPGLGQLSLCAPVPEDEEVWQTKPAVLRSQNGHFLYEAVGNVGTSCLLRRELWDAGIRVGSNTNKHGVLLPDDVALSESVRHAGYMCAWAPRYLARNLGHAAGELDDRAEYYARSYDAKPWLGTEGLSSRMEAWRTRPRPQRASLLFQGESIYPELSLAAPSAREPRLWSMFDGWTADVETLEFLYGLVRAVKPRLVVETRAWRGYVGEAIGRALAQNGIGQLISVEADPDCRRIAAERLGRAGVDQIVRLLDDAPAEPALREGVDLVVLDGMATGQAAELQEYAPYLRPGALVVAYRSGDASEAVPDRQSRFSDELPLEVLSLPTPRELTLCQYTGSCGAAGKGLAYPQARPEPSTDEPAALLVLGMHRSGTSALTRVLNLHGVELGSSLLAGNAANERGFWEHADIMVLNDQVLGELGMSWSDPRRLPEGCWERPRLWALQHELGATLRREFAGRPLWGAKDPRLCRLLPLWQRVLADMGAAPRYVIPLRSPYEVADSLQRRDGLSRNRGLLLWLRHVLEAERHSRGALRVFTTYDQLLSDWRGTVSRIAGSLGLRLPLSDERVETDVEAFLTPALRHHSDAVSAGEPRGLRSLVDGVYGHLASVAAGDVAPDAAFLDQAALELDALEDVFAALSPAPPPMPFDGDAQGPDRPLDYADWTRIYALRESDGELLAERMVLNWRVRPSVHLIAPLRTGETQLLAPTLQSLSDQLYPGWGLTVVAEEPCPDALFGEQPNLEWYQCGDDPESAINRAIADTDADWVGLIRPGDRLAPNALFACIDHLQQSPDWALIYSDEDRMDAAGRRADPWFKTDADPDLLRSQDGVGSFCLVRREVLLAAGGYSSEPGIRNYELALKVLERCGTECIGHVADVLYHRGPVTEALRGDLRLMPWRRAALAAHLERCGQTAEVAEGLATQTLRVCYQHAAHPMVSVIVAVRDDLHVLEIFIDSLRDATRYAHMELLIVDEGSEDEDTYDYLDLLRHQGLVRVVTAPTPGNRAAAYNAAVEVATGEYLVFIDRHSVFVQETWLEELLNHAQRPDVGVVAPRVVGPDKTVAHSALLLGIGGVAADAFAGLSAWDPGYFGRALTDQGVSAVPGACLMVRRAAFEAIGPFDEQMLPNVWYPADLCLRLRNRGLRVVWTPHALLGWQPPQCAGGERPGCGEEGNRMLQRWLGDLAHDPYYNRNLSLSHRDFRTRTESTASWDPSFNDRPRILGIPVDTYGCGEYRVLAPLNALAAAARARCGFAAPQEGWPRVPSIVELERLDPDTLLLQGTLDDAHLDALESYKRFNRAFRVFDMEDLKTQVPEKNSRRKLLFRDIKARTRRALSCCDRLIVTTDPIAEVYRDIIDDIRVLPNYLPRSRWGTLRSLRRQGPRPRVGWAGGQQHLGDLELLIPVVQATAKEVDWVFFGMCPDALRPFVREVHEFGEFAQYPVRLAALNLDLAVAPLEDHPFNIAKSNLRILEYGVLGWPVVCTDIEPYRGGPVKRVRNDPAAWIDAIRERAHDLGAAAQEGDRLKDWVLNGWMLEDHLDDWMASLTPGDKTRPVAECRPVSIARHYS